MKNVLNALDAMLEAYRKKERDFPSYDELAGLLKAPAILVSADPAENEAIARDAQAIVAAGVAALAADALKAAANWVSAEHASARNVGAGGPGKIKEETEAGRKAEAAIKALATRACLSAAAPQVVADERKPFSGPGAWFSVDVLGNPMREYAPGKWENCVWPSAAPVQTAMTLDKIMGEAAKHKRALVPLHINRAMQEVMDDDGWQWEDLLGAAEAITDEQYAEIQAAPVQAQEPVAYVNGDDLDNMLDDRTASIQSNASGWRRVALYRAPVQPVAVPDGALLASVTALAHKWNADAVKDGFAASDAGQELLEILGWPDPAPAAQGDAIRSIEVDDQGPLGVVTTTKYALANAQDAKDAERWRALLGSARIRMIGSAGLEKPQPNNYAHFGMEIWTTYGGSLSPERLEEMAKGNEMGKRWLTTYADIAIAAIAAKAAS